MVKALARRNMRNRKIKSNSNSCDDGPGDQQVGVTTPEFAEATDTGMRMSHQALQSPGSKQPLIDKKKIRSERRRTPPIARHFFWQTAGEQCKLDATGKPTQAESEEHRARFWLLTEQLQHILGHLAQVKGARGAHGLLVKRYEKEQNTK